MNRFAKRILLFMLASFVVVACNSKKRLGYEKPKNKPNGFLEEQLARDFDFETLSFKIGTKAKIKGKNQSFKTSVRIKKDSIIWATILFGPKPLATTIITQDSVKFVNKIEKTYFKGTSDYLRRTFGTDISYETLQHLLVGEAIDYSPKINYKYKTDSIYYHITGHDKRKVKLDNGQKLKLEYFYAYWLNPNTFTLARQNIRSEKDTTVFDARYTEYTTIDEQAFPAKVNIEIQLPRDTITIGMKNSKLKRNIDLTFPLRISDKYTEIK